MFVMPFDLPNLPVCPEHVEVMEGLTMQEAFTLLVDFMTEEEGMDILKEIMDNDDEF